MPILKLFLTGGVGPGSYYYPVLLQLVFIAPVIFLLIEHYHKAGLMICCIFNVTYELVKWKCGMSAELYRLLAFRYVMLFAFGSYFAEGGKFSSAQSICLAAAGLVSVFLNAYRNITLFFITYWRTTSFATTLHVIPLFYWLKSTQFKCGFFERIGKASYNIYLVQMVYFAFFAGWLYDRIPYTILRLVINLVLCVCMGLLFYVVETPVTRFVIKWYRKAISCIHSEKIDRG